MIILANEAPIAAGGLANEPAAFELTGNIVHWSSTKCKRVTQSVLASEIYGMVSGYDLGFVIQRTLVTIAERLNMPPPPLILCTDSVKHLEGTSTYVIG